MAKKSSGALTNERLQEQEALYAGNPTYDYVIIGAGMAALSVGALLAKAGQRVCLLEAHDTPGGYAHTFGQDGFSFSAEVHYIWGCAPGQAIYQFLQHLGLHEEITFQAFDPEGYDHAALPDGTRVKIPYGFDKLVDNLDAAYPGERSNIEKFVSIIREIRDCIRSLPTKFHWWDPWIAKFKYPTLMKYKDDTLQDLFQQCQLGREVQAALCANAGDFGAPPNELSLFAYVSLLSGYNEGAYYPTKHFKFFTNRIAEFIQEQEGCHIYYETEVVDIDSEGSRIVGVQTADGKTFRGENYLCNMDPQKASHMIGREKFPKSYLPALSYQYSPSSFTLYLGVEGIDLRDHGFGSFNIWHLEQWDMNKMWKEQMAGKFDNPWLFISTPSLRTSDATSAPKGCQTIECGTLVSYEYFDKLQKESPEKAKQRVGEIRDRFLDLIEQKYVPNFRKHLKLTLTGTPKNNEQFCHAPFGNCYGAQITPHNMGIDRLSPKTPWENLYWCNASSGHPGIYGTTLTGLDLYADLSGETIFDLKKRPSEQEAIAFAKTRVYP